MVAWRRVLLFVAGLMLLVDDHQSQSLKRQKHRAACTEDDAVRLVGELLLPNLHALGIAVFAMVYAEPAAEDSLQSLGHLHGEGYLGQEIEHLFAFGDGLLNKMDVDFGLATGSHAMEQHHVLFLPLRLNVVHGLGLGVVECLHILRMGLTGTVEPSHLAVIGFKKSVHDELPHDSR